MQQLLARRRELLDRFGKCERLNAVEQWYAFLRMEQCDSRDICFEATPLSSNHP
jgi:hypothetical protein